MRNSRPILTKLGVIGVIAVLLMIPLHLIRSLIEERENRLHNAGAQVGDLWGGRQRVAGPILSVPVLGPANGRSEDYSQSSWLHLLPDELEIDADVEADERRRGIFETVVYSARLDLRAKFRLTDEWRSLQRWRHRWGGQDVTLDWAGAVITLGLTNLRGLGESPSLRWRDEAVEALPATGTPALFGTGLTSPISLAGMDGGDGGDAGDAGDAGDDVAEFKATMLLNGSDVLEFLPLGKNTGVDMTSGWGDPSFQGAFLPSTRDVQGDTFTATWSIPHFARNFPQTWLERPDSTSSASQENLKQMGASAFGAEWLLPVDFYQKAERCIKYSLLFIGLTFGCFLLFELLHDLRVHPVQYLMVGVAMCLFYQLLLAISEHLAFAPSYFTAASATVLLISGYSSAVLKTRRRGAVLMTSLAALYGVLFVLVQLQTYTLLVGSVALFFGLALFMYLTRELDWYELSHFPTTDLVEETS